LISLFRFAYTAIGSRAPVFWLVDFKTNQIIARAPAAVNKFRRRPIYQIRL